MFIIACDLEQPHHAQIRSAAPTVARTPTVPSSPEPTKPEHKTFSLFSLPRRSMFPLSVARSIKSSVMSSLSTTPPPKPLDEPLEQPTLLSLSSSSNCLLCQPSNLTTMHSNSITQLVTPWLNSISSTPSSPAACVQCCCPRFIHHHSQCAIAMRSHTSPVHPLGQPLAGAHNGFSDVLLRPLCLLCCLASCDATSSPNQPVSSSESQHRHPGKRFLDAAIHFLGFTPAASFAIAHGVTDPGLSSSPTLSSCTQSLSSMADVPPSPTISLRLWHQILALSSRHIFYAIPIESIVGTDFQIQVNAPASLICALRDLGCKANHSPAKTATNEGQSTTAAVAINASTDSSRLVTSLTKVTDILDSSTERLRRLHPYQSFQKSWSRVQQRCDTLSHCVSVLCGDPPSQPPAKLSITSASTAAATPEAASQPLVTPPSNEDSNEAKIEAKITEDLPPLEPLEPKLSESTPSLTASTSVPSSHSSDSLPTPRANRSATIDRFQSPSKFLSPQSRRLRSRTLTDSDDILRVLASPVKFQQFDSVDDITLPSSTASTFMSPRSGRSRSLTSRSEQLNNNADDSIHQQQPTQQPPLAQPQPLHPPSEPLSTLLDHTLAKSPPDSAMTLFLECVMMSSLLWSCTWHAAMVVLHPLALAICLCISVMARASLRFASFSDRRLPLPSYLDSVIDLLIWLLCSIGNLLIQPLAPWLTALSHRLLSKMPPLLRFLSYRAPFSHTNHVYPYPLLITVTGAFVCLQCSLPLTSTALFFASILQILLISIATSFAYTSLSPEQRWSQVALPLSLSVVNSHRFFADTLPRNRLRFRLSLFIHAPSNCHRQSSVSGVERTHE